MLASKIIVLYYINPTFEFNIESYYTYNNIDN